MKEALNYLICLMILSALSSCVKATPLPYDRILRKMDEACVHQDKDKMEAVYKLYMDEIFEQIATCREKGFLKEIHE